ncbi:hypothetical protein ABZ671_01120 [Micromonospora sp. NPDC006766]|uniref:hypothetical protein n=1 Tax=Micromonospora sp. NPDC006766 TaxID=3154778 RepID=UPI0033C0E74D
MATTTNTIPNMGPNPAYVRADQERRRSNAAGRRDSRPRRQRTRATVRTAAIRDHQ